MRYHGSAGLEILRKAVHILVGVLIVCLFQAGVVTLATFGLLIVIYTAVVFYNFKAERELLTKILSINRADRYVPGLDILFYFVGCWIVLWLFDRQIAFAAILILAFGDAIAHVISRSFGATQTVLTTTTYLEGTIAGIVAGALAAWLGTGIFLVPALVAATAAMIIEAGEFRIASHHVDDNLTIPIVAGIALWVISLVFTIS